MRGGYGRLLQNLISNALKYTLSVRLPPSFGRGPHRGLGTGRGIPPEHQRTVFAEPRRLDQGARVARGLGLGLSIVECLGRVLSHPVGLRSCPGRESVFFETTPLGRAQPIPRCARWRNDATAPSTQLETSGTKITACRLSATDDVSAPAPRAGG